MRTLYFEGHVTVEPLLDPDRLETFKALCAVFHARPSDRAKVPPKGKTPALHDFGCTLRTSYPDEMRVTMANLIKALRDEGIKVYRCKIEDTVMDTNINDLLGMLDPTEREEYAELRGAQVP